MSFSNPVSAKRYSVKKKVEIWVKGSWNIDTYWVVFGDYKIRRFFCPFLSFFLLQATNHVEIWEQMHSLREALNFVILWPAVEITRSDGATVAGMLGTLQAKVARNVKCFCLRHLSRGFEYSLGASLREGENMGKRSIFLYSWICMMTCWLFFNFIISVIFHTCSAIIIFRIVAYLAYSVVCSVMCGVICCIVSPYPRAAQFASIYDLIIINRYNHSAITRRLYSQGVANTADVSTDAHI